MKKITLVPTCFTVFCVMAVQQGKKETEVRQQKYWFAKKKPCRLE